MLKCGENSNTLVNYAIVYGFLCIDRLFHLYFDLWQPDRMEGVITPIRFRSNRQPLEKFKSFPTGISQEDIIKETIDFFGVIKSNKKQFIKNQLKILSLNKNSKTECKVENYERKTMVKANYLLIHLKTLFLKNFSNSKIIAAGESKHHVLRMFNNTWTTRSGKKLYIMSHLPVTKNYYYTLKNHIKKHNKKLLQSHSELEKTKENYLKHP